ncbi:hypothetical protein SAMN05421788_102312 [Filimonas lacunae]|uniref:Uncharacterized protein n=1 Tax=Filimonas lacunae TaxID=477680 RepID=A0A1N7NBF7_9BACT|nr:hypothetical protein SAMN05421788_102312 [Filimonas lacunae]
MAHPVLNEDWSEYDNRKIIGYQDRSQFSCTESWEVNYLVNKLRKHFPYKTDTAIRMAIAACCNSTNPPHARVDFVECVVRRLNC